MLSIHEIISENVTVTSNGRGQINAVGKQYNAFIWNVDILEELLLKVEKQCDIKC